jgi:hypothetical protein
MPRMEVLRVSYVITRRLFPTTDVFIFHEDYNEEDKKLFPGVKEFIRVDFSGFDSDYNPNFGRKGYLMMCRFFCGSLQQTPQLQNYSHYMRLDDDSFFMKPYLTEDIVKQSLLTNQYVYRSIFWEAIPQQTLFIFTIHFLKNIRKVNFLKMNEIISALENEKITIKGKYSGIAPYNNFHICPIQLWRLPIVKHYLECIENERGFLRYGWLDANVHAMILYVLSKVDSRIMYILNTSFGYRHNSHIAKINDYIAISNDEYSFYPTDLEEE